MKISEKTFILVTESSHTIIVDDYLEELLREKMRPIVWFRDGLFGVVPAAILMNMFEFANIFAGKPKLTIHWSQAYEISDEVGRSLITL